MRMDYETVFMLRNFERNVIISAYSTFEEALAHFKACDHQDRLEIKPVRFSSIVRMFECAGEISNVLGSDKPCFLEGRNDE